MSRIVGLLNRYHPMERAAWLLAAACLVLTVVSAGRPVFTNASRPVRGIAVPVFALQTIRGIEELDAILSDAPSPDREVMRVKQFVDFVLIAAYGALFAVMAAALARVRRVAFAILVLAWAAALFDILENASILKIVDTGLQAVQPAMLDRLRVLSAWKSVLQAAGILACSVFFCLSPGGRARLAGLVGIAAAGLIAAALFHHPLLPWAGPALAAALCGYAVTLKFPPHESSS
ncbi:MAG: hypothetical protein EXQ47_12360 [Bryobacterales bacterium]|nr:hypothetical protein [Bryobacterales bacterium]